MRWKAHFFFFPYTICTECLVVFWAHLRPRQTMILLALFPWVTDRTKSFVFLLNLSGLNLSRRSSSSSPTHFVHSVSLISGPLHGHAMIVSLHLSCSASGRHRSCINLMLPHYSLFLLPNITHATDFCATLLISTNLLVRGTLMDILFCV